MAPLPKRRHSTQRQGKRRAAIKLALVKLIRCTNCKELIKSHTTCPNCGYYQGREMVKMVIGKKDENKKRSAAPATNRSR